MKVKLYIRSSGRHQLVRECEIEGTFRRYGKIKKTGNESVLGREFEINEERLLKALPKKFLIDEPHKNLVFVTEGDCGTGLSDLKIFRPWSKYFTSYSIELIKRK